MRLVVAAAASSAHLHRAIAEQGLHQTICLKNRASDVCYPTWNHGKIVFSRKICTAEPRRKNLCARVDPGNVVSSDTAETYDVPPPGCTRVKVELSKPLGIVLEEDKAGNIFVAEVVKDGNADKSGLVDVGDQLIATSALIYGSEDFYQGVKVRKGMQIVRLSVFGEKFETVMAAIGTHPAYVKVALEIQKCQRPTIRAENNGAANK